jgi:hypothetical protein
MAEVKAAVSAPVISNSLFEFLFVTDKESFCE